jgi:plastocyanin
MFRTMRAFGVLLLATALVGAACGDDDDNGGTTTTASAKPQATTGGGGGIPAALTTVKVQDNKFTPGALQIPVGATVTWDWTGSAARHSVKGTFDGQPVESPTLSGGGVYLFAFQKAGIFEYECGVHGAAMKGVVTIQ